MNQKDIIEALMNRVPFEGLVDIEIIAVTGDFGDRPKDAISMIIEEVRPDVLLKLAIAGTQVDAFADIRTQVSPKLLRQIIPWLSNIKQLKENLLSILVCPYLSPTSQEYCLKNKIDFIDLSGNISLSLPGKIFFQRLNMPNKFKLKQLIRNPFSRASSRVIRVLLQNPNNRWTITSIANELLAETQRQAIGKVFKLSISSISKTIKTLEEELLVLKRGSQILVPDPRQLLMRWGEKYRETYKRDMRNALICSNQIGIDFESSIRRLREKNKKLDFIVTGATAANLVAPFVSVDRIEILPCENISTGSIIGIGGDQKIGPDFVFVFPSDDGVFMYASEAQGIPIASEIQIYLDSMARGGRDVKQAEYLFSHVIEQNWEKT